MGDPNQKHTEFTPMQVLHRRAQSARKRGDRYVQSLHDIKVKFDQNFDQFAASVAYELRHKIVYRTDGGNFARGLVRQTGDLKLLHDVYLTTNTPAGSVIRLNVIFVRRQDPVPPNRWTMSLRFIAPDWVEEEEEVIVADQTRVTNARCTALERIHVCMESVAKNLPGLFGERVRRMIAIADQVDCPKSLDLWYYNRAAAIEFFTWRTSDDRRNEMMATTKGKLPFDGYIHPHGEWRIYPFRDLVQKFAHKSLDDCGPEMQIVLEFHHTQIANTFHDINRELNKADPLLAELNKFYKGASSMYGLGEPFLEHLKKLQDTKDHLYSAFK